MDDKTLGCPAPSVGDEPVNADDLQIDDEIFDWDVTKDVRAELDAIEQNIKLSSQLLGTLKFD